MVSIVIPVYNGSNYMREAIDSALAQTYPNIEVLVVNDGSTDNTREIALSYGDKIRYFEKENGGVSTALNLAIEKMRGDYFSWLSHDDRYYPNKILAEIKVLQEHNDRNLVIHSGWDAIVMPKGNVIPYNGVDLPAKVSKKINESSILPLMFSFMDGLSLLIPKELLVKYGGFEKEYVAIQDYLMWHRILKGRKSFFIPKQLTQYRLHPNQTTNTYKKKTEEEDYLFETMIKNFDEDDLIDVNLNEYQVLGMMLFQTKRRGLFKAYEMTLKRLRDVKLKKTNFLYKELYEYLDDGDIYIYGAGKNGIALFEALVYRGIRCVGFIDCDENKIGKYIDGVPCLNLNNVDQNTQIIISVQSPYEIYNMLSDMGFVRISTYIDLWEMILRTPISEEYR